MISQDSYPRKSIPREPGKIFGKERVNREEFSKSVRLVSVVLARQNSRKDHMSRPWNKKGAPAELHGTLAIIFISLRIRTKVLSILLLKREAGTYFNQTRRARICS